MKEINEVWKDIEGYEGLYQVSNLGKVKSLERIDRHNHLVKERILTPKTEPNGYLRLGLRKNCVKKMFMVHRLVAQAFIPNPEGLPVINHKDEDKTNNVVFLKDDGSVDECRSNLEWCTQKHNINWGTRIERIVNDAIKKGRYNKYLVELRHKDYKEYERVRHQMWYRRRKKKQPSEESLW